MPRLGGRETGLPRISRPHHCARPERHHPSWGKRRQARSGIICPVTTSRAVSVLAVMSPNPTVENTVTVKYSASVRVSGAVKLPGGEPGRDEVGAGEQRQEQRHAGGERLDRPQARERRGDDRADLEGDQSDEHHQPDDQHRDDDGGGGAVERQQIIQGHDNGDGRHDPQRSPCDHAARGPDLTPDASCWAGAVGHRARRDFPTADRKDRPRSCHTMPTTAPRMITTPIASRTDMMSNTMPIAPYLL